MSRAEWDRCAPWIEAALAHAPFYTLDEVFEEIESGGAILWPGKNAAIVTQFWNFPRDRAINFWLAGGDLDELVDEIRPAIEEWAKAHARCTKSIIAGRKGWERALKSHGYQPVWTALSKDLT